MSQYVHNKSNTTWKVLCTGYYAAFYLFIYLFFIRDLTLDSLVRFLVGQQLERKYRTPVLFLKYSI